MSSTKKSELFLPSRVANGVRWEKQSITDWLVSLETGHKVNTERPIHSGDRMANIMSLPHGMPTIPRYWDISYIAREDPDSGTYSSHLGALAVQYEDWLCRQTQAVQQLWNEYETVQNRLRFLFEKILSQNSPGSEQRVALNSLYQETIDKLQFLLDQTPEQNRAMMLHPNTAAVTAPPPADLATYMTSWLRANFTNPYPDEAGLAEMATACGTTPGVISNWLINARTRKWRPAIVQATELNRSADHLLEDAICIFNGETPRVDNTIEDDGKYADTRKRSRGFP